MPEQKSLETIEGTTYIYIYIYIYMYVCVCVSVCVCVCVYEGVFKKL